MWQPARGTPGHRTHSPAGFQSLGALQGRASPAAPPAPLPTPLLQQLCRRTTAQTSGRLYSANTRPQNQAGKTAYPGGTRLDTRAHQVPLGRPPQAGTGLWAPAQGSQRAPSRASWMHGAYPSPPKTWHSQAVGSCGWFRTPDPTDLFSLRRPQASPEDEPRNLQHASLAFGLLFSGSRSRGKLVLCSRQGPSPQTRPGLPAAPRNPGPPLTPEHNPPRSLQAP